MNVFIFTMRYLWRCAVYRWRPRARPSADKPGCLKVCIHLEPNLLGWLLGCKAYVLGPIFGKEACWKMDGRKLRSPLLRWYLHRLYDRYTDKHAIEPLPENFRIAPAQRLAA